MKLKILCLIVLYIVLFQNAFSQASFTAFFVDGASTHQWPGSTKFFEVVAFSHSNANSDFTYRWESHPEGFITPGMGKSRSTFGRSLLSHEHQDPYYAICTVFDDKGDSIRLTQLVIPSFEVHTEFYELKGSNNQTINNHTFTNDDLYIDFPYCDGCIIEYEGNGSSYINLVNEDNPSLFVFNADMSGSYTIKFVLNYHGKAVGWFTKFIEVGDSETGAVMVQKKDYYVDNSSGSRLIPDVRFKEDNLSGTVRFTSTFPGSIWTTPSDFTVRDHQMQLNTFGFEFTDEGTYDLIAHIQLSNGEEFELKKSFTYHAPPKIRIASDSGCIGDTVRIPVTYEGITQEMQFEYFDIDIEYNKETVIPVGISSGIPSFSYKSIDILFYNEGVINIIREKISEYRLHDFFADGDTLFFVDFKILKEGTQEIKGNTNDLFSYPDYYFQYFQDGVKEVEAGMVKGKSSKAKESVLTKHGIKGLSLVQQLEVNPYNPNFFYQWTEDNSNTKSILTEVAEDKEICLKITDSIGCTVHICENLITNNTVLFSISGLLINEDRDVIQGEVVAYKQDNNNYYPAGKAYTLADGSFTIKNLEPGIYLLLGIPDDLQYNAAYYYGEGIRNRSDLLPVSGHVSDIDFVLSRKTTGTGETFSGVFGMDDTTRFYRTTFEGLYGKLPEIIFLTNTKGEIVDWTLMNEKSTYTVTNNSTDRALVAHYGRVSDELQNHHLVTSLNAGQREVNRVHVYPNPFSDYFYIDHAPDTHVEVFQTDGKQVVSYLTDSANSKIGTSHLERGSYLLKITSNNEYKVIHILKY